MAPCCTAGEALCAAKGEHENAIDDFTAAIRLDPRDAEAYCARGAVYGSAVRDFNKAIADFTEAIHLDSLLAKAYYDRGKAYEAAGKKAEAERDFERARELKYKPE